MSKVLIITNGDCAVTTMCEAGIEGDYLPWRDVLHDGPVPANLDWFELSKTRARYIADQGWSSYENVLQHFQQRDSLLEKLSSYDKVTLWFEHDLYDQLHILQVLDYLVDKPFQSLTMICTDNYLGMVSAAEMLSLQHFETAVNPAQFELAKNAWAAFRSDKPKLWAYLLQQDTSALHFLSGAILRQLEEYPDSKTGLSRTAYQALKIIQKGVLPPGKLFGEYNKTEERRFMGDLSFWAILQSLLEGPNALIKIAKGQPLLPIGPEKKISLTEKGEDILSGKANALDLLDINRWVGGVHLHKDNIYCWNAVEQSISQRLSH